MTGNRDEVFPSIRFLWCEAQALLQIPVKLCLLSQSEGTEGHALRVEYTGKERRRCKVWFYDNEFLRYPETRKS